MKTQFSNLAIPNRILSSSKIRIKLKLPAFSDRKTDSMAIFPLFATYVMQRQQKKRRADRPRLPSPAHISDYGNSAISQLLYKQLHRHGLHTVRQRPEYGVLCRFLLLQAVRQHCRQPPSAVLRQKQPLRRHRHEH